MEWATEQDDLGSLGLAGICRETRRVVHRAMLPNFVNLGPPLLSALLLANVAAIRTLLSPHVLSDLTNGSGLLDLVTSRPAFFLLATGSTVLLVVLWLLCTAAYAFCVASLYRTGGDFRAADRALKGLPAVPLARLACTVTVAVPVLVLYTSLSAAALLRLQDLLGGGAPDEIVLPLRLLGWAACLAGAAYVAAVCQLACVVSLLEDDAVLFGALRRSRALLAGKVWAAAGVFVVLDGCVFAVQVAFAVLVVDNALGLGLGFQVVAGAAMALALCAVVLWTMVAHPVVYVVCKDHHREVAGKVHHD